MAPLTLPAVPVVLAIDTGDTAWLLAASALVLLMAPGLALFYGGMVRSKSVLNMMMMTFGALAAIIVLWVVVGYSLAFGDDVGMGLLGNPFDHFGLQDMVAQKACPHLRPSRRSPPATPPGCSPPPPWCS